MHIKFFVGNSEVEFVRDPITGRAEAKTESGNIVLQDPLDLGTHISLGLLKEWRFAVAGSNILTQKKRPLFLAGLRQSRYRIFVDDKLVSERTGI